MKVLNAIFVREFYLANTGFFLLIVAIAGGFMRSNEHVALAEFFVSTPTVMTIPIVVWTLYTSMVMHFNDERILLDENEFVFCFAFLPKAEQWALAARVAWLQLLPAFLYGSFLCIVAWKHQLFFSILMTCLSCGLLLCATSLRLLSILRNPKQDKNISFISRIVNTRVTKPFPLFFIEWMVRNDFLMMAGTKIFTMLCVFGITELYQTDSYDGRLLALGIIIASTANATCIQALHRFENFHMAFLKALPLSFLKRFAYTLTTMFILAVPEIIVLIRNFPTELPWTSYITNIALLISIQILIYGGLYIKDRNQQDMMTIVFCLGITWFLAVLFKIPTGLIAVGNVVLGLYLWQRFYYSFEYISKE
jgi:hypothetical protein